MQTHSTIAKRCGGGCPKIMCMTIWPVLVLHWVLRLQLTYPLDTLRLRLAVDPSVAGMRGAAAALMREGRGLAFYRGLGVALIGGQSDPKHH